MGEKLNIDYNNRYANLPPTCTMYQLRETLPQASQSCLHKDQSMHQQESFAWHKCHNLPRVYWMHTNQLPAEVNSEPGVDAMFVEVWEFRACVADTESWGLLR